MSVREGERKEQWDAPKLDAGRGGGVPADAVGAGDVAALELADLLAIDEPGEGILLPVNLIYVPVSSPFPSLRPADGHIPCSRGSC